MARTWLSIRVDLIEGGDQTLWPRPQRVFATVLDKGSFVHGASTEAFRRDGATARRLLGIA